MYANIPLVSRGLTWDDLEEKVGFRDGGIDVCRVREAVDGCD